MGFNIHAMDNSPKRAKRLGGWRRKTPSPPPVLRSSLNAESVGALNARMDQLTIAEQLVPSRHQMVQADPAPQIFGGFSNPVTQIDTNMMKPVIYAPKLKQPPFVMSNTSVTPGVTPTNAAQKDSKNATKGK